MTSGHSKASRKQSAEEELDVGNVSDEKMSKLSSELSAAVSYTHLLASGDISRILCPFTMAKTAPLETDSFVLISTEE